MANEGKVFLASDHAGFALKKQLLEFLTKELSQLQFVDLGCPDTQSVDYPDYAASLGREVSQSNMRGILVCGSGIGVCMAANKIKGVRAATIWDATSARLCREHNDANVLCLGARLTGVEVAFEAAKVFLTTGFLAGRHSNRISKISALETKPS